MTAENSTMIYISDMDGTLLRNDGTISPYTRQKLTDLLNAGVNITVASARSAVSIRQILADIPFRLPVIEINGAFVTDFATGEHLIINEMSKPILQNIYSAIKDHRNLPFVTAFDGKQDRLYYERITSEGMQLYHDDRELNKDTRLTRTADIEGAFAGHIVGFTVINTYEKVKPLADELKATLASRLETHFFENPYSPGWWWLTIHDKQACKSIAMKEVVDYAGFKLENLVVFGDNLNDVKMFKAAARSIAVQNASDEIKSHATEIIGPNHEDSVIKYIEKDATAP